MIDWVSRQAWTEEQNVHFKKNWQLYCLLKDTPDFVVSLKLKLDLEKDCVYGKTTRSTL